MANETNPRLRLTPSNWARSLVHPTGFKDITTAIADELLWNDKDCRAHSSLANSGKVCDFAKYWIYGTTAGSALYEFAIKQLIEKI